MSDTKKDVKIIIESSRSEEELLNNIDSFNQPLAKEELGFVNGGFDAGGCVDDASGCTNNAYEWNKCSFGAESSMCGEGQIRTCGSANRYGGTQCMANGY